MGRALLAVSVLLLVAMLGGATYAVLEPVKVFGVSGESVAASLEAELEAPRSVGELDPDPCRELAEGRYRCDVLTPAGYGPGDGESLGVGDSTVTVDDAGCWEVRRAEHRSLRGEGGCIDFFDAVHTPLF